VRQVAQRYLDKPFLVDGLKFDMRMYVLVSSVEPLRAWLYDEGLCRFATTPYAAPAGKNMEDMTLHLTNYAVNKNSPNFVFNTGGVDQGNTGSKRTISWFMRWLDEHGYSSHQVFGRIVHMVNKALLAAQPHLARTYRIAVGPEDRAGAATALNSCSVRAFEVLGLDVLLDHKLRPWLLEVNHSPSFTCDTSLDYSIKLGVIGETMDLLRMRSQDRKKAQEMESTGIRSRLGGAAVAPTPTPAMPAAEGATAAAGAGTGAGAAGGGASAIRALSGSRPSSVEGSGSGDEGPGNKTPVRSGSKQASAQSTPKSSAGTTGGARIPGDNSVALIAPLYDYPHIPLNHIKHELSTAKGYTLIFPPPDPALVSDAVFARNAEEHARTQRSIATLVASMKREQEEAKRKRKGGAAASESEQSADGAGASGAAVDEDDDEDEEDEDAVVVPVDASDAASSADDTPGKAGTEPDIDTAYRNVPWLAKSSRPLNTEWKPPVVDGVPLGHFVPWETSREELYARIREYGVFSAVSDELFNVESKAEATAGRRVAEMFTAESSNAIVEAIKKAEAAEKASPLLAMHGPAPKSVADAYRQVSAFSDAIHRISESAQQQKRDAESGGPDTRKPKQQQNKGNNANQATNTADGAEKDEKASVPRIPRVALLAQQKQVAAAEALKQAEEQRTRRLAEALAASMQQMPAAPVTISFGDYPLQMQGLGIGPVQSAVQSAGQMSAADPWLQQLAIDRLAADEDVALRRGDLSQAVFFQGGRAIPPLPVSFTGAARVAGGNGLPALPGISAVSSVILDRGRSVNAGIAFGSGASSIRSGGGPQKLPGASAFLEKLAAPLAGIPSGRQIPHRSSSTSRTYSSPRGRNSFTTKQLNSVVVNPADLLLPLSFMKDSMTDERVAVLSRFSETPSSWANNLNAMRVPTDLPTAVGSFWKNPAGAMPTGMSMKRSVSASPK
jgi:hypothetical protein